jgi:integrase
MPDYLSAKKLSLQIDAACANGTYVELRRQLEEHAETLTIAQLGDMYLDYYRKHNRAPAFVEHNLKPIKRIVGHVDVTAFSRAHGNQFKRERSKDVYHGKPIEPSTVNRGVAVLSAMLTYAAEEELIPVNPIKDKFRKLKEPPPRDRFMTLEEERRLVDCVRQENDTAGLYSALLGETGLRAGDGRKLEVSQFDFQRRFLLRRTSKAETVVQVPLSDYAMEILAQIPRVVGSRYLFTQPGTREAIKEYGLYKALRDAKVKAGMDWVEGFHDFRHFRATQWLLHGVAITNVQRMLGHTNVQTTMRYIHYAESHAAADVTRAQQREQEALAAAVAAGNK